MQAPGNTTSWVIFLFLQNYQMRHTYFKFVCIYIGTLLLKTFTSVYTNIIIFNGPRYNNIILLLHFIRAGKRDRNIATNES